MPPPAARLSDEELLSTPTADSFADFYQRHVRAILGYFARVTRDPETAADLTAETFAAALSGRSRYRPEVAPATAWLFGIAGKKAADWRRRGYAEDRARRRLAMERIDLTERDRTDFDALTDDYVAHLLSDLSPDERDAVTARVLEDRAYDEIAAETGVPAATVRKRVSRALGALRGKGVREP